MESLTKKHLWVEINTLKKHLEAVERQAAQLKISEELSPEEEFRREFPHMKIARKLFNLVGIDPYLSLEDEKEELSRILTNAYESGKDIS